MRKVLVILVFTLISARSSYAACEENGCYIGEDQAASVLFATLQGNPDANKKVYDWYGTTIESYSIVIDDQKIICDIQLFNGEAVAQTSCSIGTREYFKGTRDEF